MLSRGYVLCRSASPGAIMQAQHSALDMLMEPDASCSGAVACRAAYRLAHYSDSLYCSIQAQKASPEYQTARAIVRQRREQVGQTVSHSSGMQIHACACTA